MTNEPKAFAPTTATRMAILKDHLRTTGQSSARLTIPQILAKTTLALDINGTISLHVECDPATISFIPPAAMISQRATPAGYVVVFDHRAAAATVEHFLDEVVELLVSGHVPGDAVREAFGNWNELLARNVGRRLSESAVVGLWGELELLSEILRLGGSLNAWTGWKRDNNDFRLPKLTIEAKTTTSADYRKIQVHGLAQLDDPADGTPLLLVLKRVEASAGGRCLNDLVSEVIELSSAASEVLNRLADVGYYEHHASDYEQYRYVSTDVALRFVDDNHPRLTFGHLRQVDLTAIDKVTYELNLNGTVESSDVDRPLLELLAEYIGG